MVKKSREKNRNSAAGLVLHAELFVTLCTMHSANRCPFHFVYVSATSIILQRKAKEGKKPVSKFLPGDNQDPFEFIGTPLVKKFVDILDWHPHFCDDDFPVWLKDYLIVYFVSEDSENPLCHAVHCLYHFLFENSTDCV
jgi:hypothetical protein